MLLAFALTFLAIFVSQQIMSRYFKPPPPVRTPAPITAAAPASGTTPSENLVAGAPAQPPSMVPVKQAGAENEMVVENELYRITFTNRGAQVKSWVLKKYQDAPKDGKPLDLVNKNAAATNGYPLSLWTYDEQLRKKLNESLFVVEPQGSIRAPGTVAFDYSSGDLVVHKRFTFNDSYVVQLETSVTQKGLPVAAFSAWPSGFGDQTTVASYANTKIDWMQGQDVQRLAAKKISGGSTISGPFSWAGVVGSYFAAVFLPEDPDTSALVTLHSPMLIPKDPKKPDSEPTKVSLLGVAVGGGANGTTRERLFVGPKNFDVLEQVRASAQSGNADITGIVDFGMFKLIAKPLFLWLNWTEEHWVHNWGWSICILTLIINLALWPLRMSSMKSSQKMQKVQPQVNAIKEKYKKYKLTDPRQAEKNQEIQEIMKREGVNPVGGCLPMLIQFPFLIAFYAMLGNAIELRHAHWLWVNDLSAPDPFRLLPILIVISMISMQRLTPQPGIDPAQQKMMTLMMPAMMGYFSWFMAAGVSLYWVLGNILGSAQQLWMNYNTRRGNPPAEIVVKAKPKKR